MNTKCAKCGSEFSADDAGGICPKCLAEMAAHPTGEAVEELPLAPGQGFRGLEVVQLVGRGGMGVVYQARQPHLDRFVALKILPRKLAADAEFRERFGREAKALAGLTHPNIVAVYDFGIENDLSFLVMEFVDGVNLRGVLRERKLSPAEALAIVPQLCDALQYAHGEGIVHRDIKPENLLLDRKGRVKIADFGLAKIVGAARTQTITKSNVAMGTPNYMAPEQLERPKEVDHRADIYSMGVVFYEMLTGELPMGKFEPPSRRVEVDVRLDEVVLKTLEKQPEKRYQSAVAVKEDVTRIAEGRAPRRGFPWKAAAVVSALVALALAVLHFAPRRRPESAAAITASSTPRAAELKLEDVVFAGRDLPAGHAWKDARHEITDGRAGLSIQSSDLSLNFGKGVIRLYYRFSLSDVEIKAFEAEGEEAGRVAAQCRINIHGQALQVLQKDRIVAAIWIDRDKNVDESRSLHGALLRRLQEKMGLVTPSARELVIEDVILKEEDLPSDLRGRSVRMRFEDVSQGYKDERLGIDYPAGSVRRAWRLSMDGAEARVLEMADTQEPFENRRWEDSGRLTDRLARGRIVAVVFQSNDPWIGSSWAADSVSRRFRHRMGFDAMGGTEYFLALQSRRGGLPPLQDLVFDPKRARCYVTESDTGSVLVFSTDELRLMGEIAVGRGPQGLDVTPDGARLYVAVSGERRVAVIDLEKLAVERTLDPAGVPYSVCVLDDRGTLAVACVDMPETNEIKPSFLGIIGETARTTLAPQSFPLILRRGNTVCVVARGIEESEIVVMKYDPARRALEERRRWWAPAINDAALRDSDQLFLRRFDVWAVVRVDLSEASPRGTLFCRPSTRPGVFVPLGDGVADSCSASIVLFDSAGGENLRFSLKSDTPRQNGLFASPDGRWVYVLSGSNLVRAAVPFVGEPKTERVIFLGLPFAQRVRALLKEMSLSAYADPCAIELVSRGRRAFDVLTEGIENEGSADVVLKVLFLLTMAKEPFYGEKMLQLAGRYEGEVDDRICFYLDRSGALKDETMRRKFSDRFRSIRPREVFDVNCKIARETGSKEAVDDMMAIPPEYFLTLGNQRLGDAWELFGSPELPEAENRFAALAAWWRANRDKVKWNAEKRVFEKAP